jgi:hypothetical protein
MARSTMEALAETLRRLGAACAAAAVLAGAGCASSDLSGDAGIGSEVAECLPTDAPVPSMVVRAVWFPNASGFGSTDAMAMGHVTGVLALAGGNLFFMAWNGPEHHFDMVHVAAVLTAAKVGVARLGSSAMLVVQSRNLSYDSFELVNEAGLGSDSKATQELYEKLVDLRSKNPEADP